VEISANHKSSSLTFTFRLILEAQKRNEPVAWISGRKSSFYPPDAERVGVDLDSLPVVWAERPLPAMRAADLLLRSGAFGMVILDLGEDSRLPSSMLPRLAMLAKRHRSALLCLTEKEEERPSLGSLVSIRAQAERIGRVGADFRSLIRIVKDKRRPPGWRHEEVFHGADGLR
jgi:recombination protein RecA